MSDAKFPLLHGHLVIFVDGYKYHYKGLTHFVTVRGANYAVPDSLMPAHLHDVGSMDWWQDGWAVGDNARNRLCARMGVKPLRRFFDYDEAVRFAYARQQKHKVQRHVLVYVTKNAMSREEQHVVRSMDDIVAIDAKNAQEAMAIKAEQERRDNETRARYPELETLRQHFSCFKARKLAELLTALREEGRAKVLSDMSMSSFYRYKRELAEVGIAIPEEPQSSTAR